MKQPKTKLIAFNWIEYEFKGAKVVTASRIEIIELNVSSRSNYAFKGRIASDPKLKIYWDENGKAHGNNRDYDLRIEEEIEPTFFERLCALWN